MSHRADRAIDELQIKVAYLEKHNDELCAELVLQAKRIKDLEDQARILYRLIQAKDESVAPFDAQADRPPHY